MVSGTISSEDQTVLRRKGMINNRLCQLGRAIGFLPEDVDFDAIDKDKMSAHQSIADTAWQRLYELVRTNLQWGQVSSTDTVVLRDGIVRRTVVGKHIELVVEPNNLKRKATRVFPINAP